MRKRTALAQTLVLDPDIILMDEPFSALDVQTRQLMENELLEIWAGGAGASDGRRTGGAGSRKAVLFITHDLDEAIALSDRVVVLSAGPAPRPIGGANCRQAEWGAARAAGPLRAGFRRRTAQDAELRRLTSAACRS